MASPNPIVESVNRFRAQLVSGQSEAATQMLDAWSGVLKSIEPNLRAVEQELDEEGVTPERLFEQARLQRILSDVAGEINKYAQFVEPLVAERQRAVIELAQKHAQSLALESLGSVPEGVSGPTWTTVDPKRLENLVGLTADGAPFGDELTKVSGQAIERVRDALIQGAALNRTPQAILSGVRDAVAGHVGRFLTIARTAEMQAYTLATMESFEENSDVVSGWRWHSSLSFDTCLACLALHGRVFLMGHPFERHFNCRCMAIPVTKSWEELGFGKRKQEHKRDWQSGEEWLQSEPEEIQRRAFGRNRFELWKHGEVELGDFLGHGDYPQWGGMYYQRSTASALETAGNRKARRAQAAIPRPKNGAEARARMDELQKQSAQAIVDLEAKAAQLTKRLERLGDQIDEAIKSKDVALEDELIEQRSKLMADRTQLRFDQQAVIDNHLSVVREKVIFVDNPSQVKVTKTARFDAKRRQIHDEGLTIFNKMVDSGLAPQADLILSPTRKKRSNYSYRDFTMNCAGGMDRRTFVHEMGHWLESHNPDVQKKTFDFLERRTKGAPLQRLRDMTGHNFDPIEMAREGGFMDAYMGKEYVFAGKRYASEILSMGMEQMYVNPEGLALKDPEYFDFIFDILHGV